MCATMLIVKSRRKTRARRKARIGPDDDGRRMPLALFSRALAEPGFTYELANGVIYVTDIPGMQHNFVVEEIR